MSIVFKIEFPIMKRLLLFFICCFLFPTTCILAEGFGSLPKPRTAPTTDDERRNADLVGTGGIFLVGAAAVYTAHKKRKDRDQI